MNAMQPIRAARFRPVDSDDTLAVIEQRMRAAHATHMGYPYNLAFSSGDLDRFGGYLINNLGDPYAGSHYASEVCGLERDVVAWFERLWECDGDGFWGSVGASGTEGNLWALYLGREALPRRGPRPLRRGPLLDPQGRPYPRHGGTAGPLRGRRRDPACRSRSGPPEPRRPPRCADADLRHHDEGRAR